MIFNRSFITQDEIVAIVNWVNSFPISPKISSVEDLGDASQMAKILYVIDEDMFSLNDSRDNWADIISQIVNYYSKRVNYNLCDDPSFQELMSISAKSFQDKNITSSIIDLIVIILGCIVSAKAQSQLVTTILGLDSNTRKTLTYLIKAVVKKYYGDFIFDNCVLLERQFIDECVEIIPPTYYHIKHHIASIGTQIITDSPIVEKSDICDMTQFISPVKVRYTSRVLQNESQEEPDFYEENKTLKQKIEQLERSESSLRSRLHILHEENLRLSNEAGSKENGVAQQSDHRFISRIEYEKLQEKVIDQENRIEVFISKTRDLNRIIKENQELKDQISINAEKVRELEQLRKKIENYRRIIEASAQLKRNYKQLEDNAREYFSKILNYETEIKEMRRQVRILQEDKIQYEEKRIQCSQIQQSVLQYETKVINLKDTVYQLQQEMEEKNIIINDQKKKIEELEITIQCIQNNEDWIGNFFQPLDVEQLEKMIHLEKETERLQILVYQRDAETHSFIQEIATLRQNLQEANHRYENIQRLSLEHENESRKWELRYEAAINEKNTISQEIQILQAEQQELQNLYHQVHQKCKTMSTEYETMLEDLENKYTQLLEQKTKGSQKKMLEKEEEIVQFKKIIAQQEKRVQNMEDINKKLRRERHELEIMNIQLKKQVSQIQKEIGIKERSLLIGTRSSCANKSNSI